MSEPPGGWASPTGDSPAPTFLPPPAQSWQTPPGWGQPRPAEPQPGVVPLRPLGLGELLDGAVTIIRRYPRPVLGMSAVLAIIATVLNVTLAETVFKPLINFDISSFENGGTGDTSQLDGALGGAAVGGIGSSLVSALATVLLTGVLTAIAGRGVLGKPMTLGEAWAEVRPALWRLLGVAFLTALLVYGSLVAGITVAVVLVAVGGAAAALIGVPLAFAGAALAVYLYCRLALAPCAALLERAGVLGSMRRSGVLVRHSWWRVFGVLLLAVVVASVVGQIVQVPFLIFGVGSNGLRGLAGASSKLLILTYVGAGIAQTVIAPFTAGVRALLYVDRRMRAEGLDVALTAAAAQRVA